MDNSTHPPIHDPAPSSRSNKLLITLATSVVGLLVVCGLIWLVVSLLNKPYSSSRSPQTSLNTSLKIAALPYQNPCELLSKESVQNIYGALQPNSYITTTYIDQSVPAQSAEKIGELGCEYELGDTADSIVKLSANYFPSTQLAALDWKSRSVNESVGALEEMDRLESEARQRLTEGNLTTAEEEAARQTIEMVRTSRSQAQAMSDRKPSEEVKGHPLPVLFDPEQGVYYMYKNSAIYTLKYGGLFTSYLVDTSPDDRAADKTKQALTIITKNITNGSAQKQTSAILGASTIGDKVALKEPCQLFSRKRLNALVAPATPSAVVKQTSTNFDSNREKTSNGLVVPISNECTRTSMGSGATPGAEATLTVYYAKTASIANAFYSHSSETKTEDATIPSADDAMLSKGRYATKITIKKGSYVATIRFASEDAETNGTTIESTKLINAMEQVASKL